MFQTLTVRHARRNGSRLCAQISRFLLTLTACLLLVMPWTEHFCNFDKFLRGGQDLELGLLAVLTVLCLVLVLFQSGRTLLASLLSCLHWCAALFRLVPRSLALGSQTGVTATLRNIVPPCPADGLLLPLRL